MNYRRMTKAQAKEFITEIDNLSEDAFDDKKAQWKSRVVENVDPEYDNLREKIVKTFDQSKAIGGYTIDLNVGIQLYLELNTATGFTNILANDDDVWRYISCVVFPDLTYERYPEARNGDVRLNQKRFYSHTRRIWLKTLWWYVHLSWQGSPATTKAVLKDFGTDTISQLIERTGRGYRLVLYRELMLAYSKQKKKSSDYFKSLTTRNRVNCCTVEPALTANGEKGYVQQLIESMNE